MNAETPSTPSLSGWIALEPEAEAGKGADRISLSIKQRRSGRRICHLLISKVAANRLGQPKYCNILAGSGENLGQLRIEFGTKGAFALKVLNNAGGLRTTFPVFHGCPAGELSSTAMKILQEDGSHLVVEAPSRAAAKAATSAERVQSTIGKVDVVEVLTAAGRRCEKVADGRWRVDGEAYSPSAILGAVNKARARTGLSPIELSQLG